MNLQTSGGGSNSFPLETLYAFPVGLIESAWAAASKVEQHCFNLCEEGSAWLAGPRALYIHIPFCLTLCQFCGFIKEKTTSATALKEFVSTLLKEIAQTAARLPSAQRQLSVIYFGGGSPSVLEIEDIAAILNQIHRYFHTGGVTEISFEGEANTLKRSGYASSLALLGVNRVSFGVQTLDSGAREILNLKPSIRTLQEVYNVTSELFSEVTVDFMFGWPWQKTESAVADLNFLIETLAPASIEAFLFEPLDASPQFLKALAERGIRPPAWTDAIKMRRAVVDRFKELGLSQLSYTKFRLPKVAATDGASTNHHTYDHCYYGWNNGQVIGVGRGSQTFLAGGMWASALTPSAYEAAVAADRPAASTFAAYELNERERVTWPRRGFINKRLVEPSTAYAAAVESMTGEGLLHLVGNEYLLTQRGEDHVPRIMNALLSPRHRLVVDRISEERLAIRNY